MKIQFYPFLFSSQKKKKKSLCANPNPFAQPPCSPSPTRFWASLPDSPTVSPTGAARGELLPCVRCTRSRSPNPPPKTQSLSLCSPPPRHTASSFPPAARAALYCPNWPTLWFIFRHPSLAFLFFFFCVGVEVWLLTKRTRVFTMMLSLLGNFELCGASNKT